ncbi:tyramine oxidase [Microbacterium sp. Root53]|uniref:primary-amine oxidase n=1 Tax=Microbacterium sp. Root53 TaxID=1736553 RepID=UPI0006F33B59|nr:primary-amine oxidase [Microbacterium sp. Root53]KQZ12005.1 tyramine oxidase [Microbacterium sp. Root53]
MSITEDTSIALAPLAPLTRDELTTAVALLKDGPAAAESFRFSSVSLKEPSKAALRSGDTTREAEAVLIDRATGLAYEAVVDLAASAVTSWTELPAGTQPPIMMDEFAECEAAIVASPLVAEALAKRGITDLSLVCAEPWSIGYWGEDQAGKRIMRALMYTRLEPNDNPYAHPMEDFTVLVDLNTQEVMGIEDDGFLHMPREKNNYHPDFVGPARTDIKPIEISFPEGRNFTVDGNHIEWLDWSFDIGFTPREGLVLHRVGFRDKGELRPILHRASLTEMVVPYGAPGRSQQLKNAFDAGEYNFGYMTNSLQLGCDCLGDIQYFDATLVNSVGKPYTIQNAICLHEEDDGLLWKHWEFRTNDAQTRRSRRLVISFVVTDANYEYAFYWYLHLDGTIQFEIKATGILSTAGIAPGETTRYGQMLNKDGLYAPIHEHIFAARLDWAVDGDSNSVYEVETVAEETDDPVTSPFYAKRTLLETEKAAARPADPLAHRWWYVESESRTNKVGEKTAYRLMPTNAVLMKKNPDNWVTKRAQFSTNTIWVSKFEEGERYPAGEYPNQSTGFGGLPEYIEADESIVNEDLVMWHSFGLNHVVRIEDWPVMPKQVTGFFIEPYGFFDENPTLNLPTESGACATSAPQHESAAPEHPHCH